MLFIISNSPLGFLFHVPSTLYLVPCTLFLAPCTLSLVPCTLFLIIFAAMPTINWGEIIFYSFAAITAIQVFYYTWFFSRIAFYEPKPKQHSQQHPVSVIICSRDEDENLARNLPGILVQQYPSTYEVVTVNDNSVDDSKYILQELKRTFKSLQRGGADA